MQLDKEKLKKLLALPDEQLQTVIQSLANEAGISPAQLGIHPEQIQSLRQALSNATDSDLKQISQRYQDYKNGRNR